MSALAIGCMTRTPALGVMSIIGAEFAMSTNPAGSLKNI
jgi:hypothetical protein